VVEEEKEFWSLIKTMEAIEAKGLKWKPEIGGRGIKWAAKRIKELEPNYHPCLHLLAGERVGWRKWIFGRWVYSSEPFRRDIQRRSKTGE